MSPEREKEYGELLAFLCFFATNVWGISPDAKFHPAHTSQEIIREYGKSKALAGLRQAVNDVVEDTRDWNAQARTIFDDALRSAGIVTLSEVIRRHAANYKRILKRGKIRSDTEYYIVNGILIDQGSDVPDDERARLQILVADYEAI